MHSTFRINDIVIMTVLFVLAILTRFYGLGDWALLADEYFTYGESDLRYKSYVNPTYYALTVLSMNVFGHNEFAARLPAFILGVVSVPVLYMAARNIFGRNAAIFAAIFLLLSSWHLHYSQNARFYSGVFLFSLLAYIYFYLSLKKDSLKYFIFSIAAGVVATSFHATAVAFFGSTALFSIVILLSKEFSDYSRKLAIIYLVIGGIILAAVAPFVISTMMSWSASGQSWGYGPIGFTLQTVKYIQIPIAVSAVFGLLYLLRVNKPLAIYFFLVIIIPYSVLVVLAKFSAVRPDYLFHILPVVIILAGFMLDKVKEAMSSMGITSYAMFFLIIISLLPEYVSYFMGKKTLDVRDAVSFFSEVYKPGDKVFTTIGGLDTYAEEVSEDLNFEFTKRIGSVFNNKVDWYSGLKEFEKPGVCVWFFLPVNRNDLAKDLESWLFKNAHMVWRKHSKRLDFSYAGYEIFLTNTCNRNIMSED